MGTGVFTFIAQGTVYGRAERGNKVEWVDRVVCVSVWRFSVGEEEKRWQSRAAEGQRHKVAATEEELCYELAELGRSMLRPYEDEEMVIRV